MRTFLILLKKEIRELLTWQIVIPMLITAGIFFGLGGILNNEQDKAKENQPIIVLDRDQTPTTALVIDTLGKANFSVSKAESSDPQSLIALANEKKAQVVVVLPEGFGQSLTTGHQQEIETYSIIRNFSVVANRSAVILDQVVSALNQYFSTQLISTNSTLDPVAVETPIITKQHVAIGGKVAEGNISAVINFVSAQTTFIPIILFFVIVFAAQMIATAVASEKENKTIETLLTMPIKRSQIVTAKMFAAGIIALLASAVYMFGFQAYMNGVTGGGIEATKTLAEGTIQSLGLQFSALSYLLLGLSLFLGILVALAIAMILGAFAEDIKSVQGLITPLMLLVMIPYIITLLLDLNTMSPALKYAIYAIPFTHPFQAAPDLLLQQTTPVLWGILYQVVAFIFFTWIAAKIFTTDRIVTLKINLNRTKKVS